MCPPVAQSATGRPVCSPHCTPGFPEPRGARGVQYHLICQRPSANTLATLPHISVPRGVSRLGHVQHLESVVCN